MRRVHAEEMKTIETQGSLLGVELEDVRSLPVGYLDEFAMYPLDFEEFCWENGLVESAFSAVRDSFSTLNEVPDFIHDRLTALFHRYLLVGGMPAAVAAFTANGVIDPRTRDSVKYSSLEIKSGAYFRSHAALDKAMATTGYGIDRAYVFAETNVFTEGNVIYLPMYMLSMLINE